MGLALLLALQAAPAAAPVPTDFDLARLRSSDDERGACGRQDATEIVVCGRRGGGGDYPLEEMARKFATKPLVAETGIGGNASVRAYGESVEMNAGNISKRAMIGIRLRF